MRRLPSARGRGSGARSSAGGEPLEIRGARVLVGGSGSGRPLVLRRPISPLGDLDHVRGVLRAEGEEVAGRVLAFPYAVGSSVGSYVLYSLARRGLAPAAILVERADITLASGCAVAGIALAELGPEYKEVSEAISGCGLVSFSARVPGPLLITCSGTS